MPCALIHSTRGVLLCDTHNNSKKAIANNSKSSSDSAARCWSKQMMATIQQCATQTPHHNTRDFRKRVKMGEGLGWTMMQEPCQRRKRLDKSGGIHFVSIARRRSKSWMRTTTSARSRSRFVATSAGRNLCIGRRLNFAHHGITRRQEQRCHKKAVQRTKDDRPKKQGEEYAEYR